MRIRKSLSIPLLAALLLTGGVTSAQTQTKTLTGGVKNDAPLQSSVHLTPEAAGRPAAAPPLQGGATGAGLYGGLDGAGGSFGVQQYNGSHMTGATTPVSSYTFTPQTSLMQIPGGVRTTPGSGFRGVQNYDGFGGTIQQVDGTAGSGAANAAPSGYGTKYSTTHGITTAGGYTVRALTTPGDAPCSPEWDYSFWSNMSRTTTSHGVTYAFGLEPKHSAEHTAQPTENKLTYGGPATSTTIFGAHDGVVSYVPGYEVRISSIGVQKQTLGGMWSVPEIKAPNSLAPEVHPLLATAQLLPSLIPKTQKVTNWQLWYERVSAAIYTRWKYADVGPGTAKVRVTIGADKQVSAQIVDFTPASDVAERDVSAETTFRETALRAVRLLTPDEIPPFPANANTSKITVDVDLQRDASTNAGYDVAKAGPEAETKVKGEVLKAR